MSSHPARIHHIFISPTHNFYGHRPKQPSNHPTQDKSEASLVAGKGLEGDRFFAYKDNFKGQITFFSMDVLAKLQNEPGLSEATPKLFRRNVLVSGINLNDLVGQKFSLSGIEFEGSEECAPCLWMDHSVGPGAKNFLAGRGGLRARILTSGKLALGEQELVTSAKLVNLDDPTRPLESC